MEYIIPGIAALLLIGWILIIVFSSKESIDDKVIVLTEWLDDIDESSIKLNESLYELQDTLNTLVLHSYPILTKEEVETALDLTTAKSQKPTFVYFDESIDEYV